MFLNLYKTRIYLLSSCNLCFFILGQCPDNIFRLLQSELTNMTLQVTKTKEDSNLYQRMETVAPRWITCIRKWNNLRVVTCIVRRIEIYRMAGNIAILAERFNVHDANWHPELHVSNLSVPWMLYSPKRMSKNTMQSRIRNSKVSQSNASKCKILYLPKNLRKNRKNVDALSSSMQTLLQR